MSHFSKAVLKTLIIFLICATLPANVPGGSEKNLEPQFALLLTSLCLRSAPDDSSEVLKNLPQGALVVVLNNTGQWLQVDYNGYGGYVRNLQKNVEILGKADFSGEKTKNDCPARENLQIKIDQYSKRAETITEKEEKTVTIFEEMERSIANARQDIKGLKLEMGILRSEIMTIWKDIRELQPRIRKLETAASKRLVATYKMQQLGRTAFFAPAASISEFMQNLNALKWILKFDETLWENLSAHQKKLESRIQSIAEKEREKNAIQTRLSRKIASLSREQKQRVELIEKIRREKRLTLSALNAFKQAGTVLDQTLASIKKDPISPEKRFMPEKPFHLSKGLLNMPVKGKIVLTFGKNPNPDHIGSRISNGIDIQADRGEPIRAVGDGVVLYADWFKAYGNLLIVDHGNHYHTIYAHAQELFKEKGHCVETGEVIATVGDTASFTGPKLHFEIRHNGKPVDPLEWINEKKRRKYAHQ